MAFKNWDAFVDKFENDDELMELLDKSGINWGKLPNDEARFEAMYNFLRTKPKTWGKEKYDELWLDYGERNYENKEGFKYNPKNIMGELGKYEDIEKDGVKTSALDQFREDYWSASKDKRDYWKTKFEKLHGENSWELAKKVMQADLHNKMMRDIEKKRSDILEGEAEDSPWYDYALSSMMGLFTPRIKSALKEGRDVGAADILGDVAENAAYAAFPVGRVGGMVAKGVAKPLSKALSQKTARGAGKLLGGALAEFGAPATIETADWLMGNTDIGKNGIDWTGEKDFEPEDIVIGGLTNLGVNKGLGRAAGMVLNTMGKKVSGKIPKPVKERLEGVKSPREKAEELVEGAKETLHAANVPHAEAYRMAVREGNGGVSIPEQQKAIDILKVAESADPEKRAMALETAKDFKEQSEHVMDRYKKELNDAESELTGAGVMHDAGFMTDEEFKAAKSELEGRIDLAKTILTEENKMLKRSEERIVELEKAGRAQNIIDILPNELDPTGRQAINQAILDGPPPASTYRLEPVEGTLPYMEDLLGMKKGTFTSNPELLSLFGKELKPTLGERALEGLFSWGVNKAGTDSDAQVAATVTRGAVDPKELRKGQYARREQKKQARAAAVLQKSIEGQGWELTDEDRKWLKMIEQNPGMVQGYGAGAGQDFHKWMLLRGTDLLRDTELARPAFTAE